jgi:hypothetical protein
MAAVVETIPDEGSSKRVFERARMSAMQDLQQNADAPKVIKAPIVEQAAGLREGDIVGRFRGSVFRWWSFKALRTIL